MSLPVILFIHDDAAARAQALASFASLPVRLVPAADREAARYLLPRESPALIVADVLALPWVTQLAPSAPLAVVASPELEDAALAAHPLALVSPELPPAEALELAELATLAASAGAGASRPPAWSAYTAAVELLQQGHYQAALEELVALAEESPRLWRAHARLATTWELAGDESSARAHRERAAALREQGAREAAAALQAHPEAPGAVRLPPSLAHERAAEPEQAAGALADIVVADDSELAREMLADVLQRAGYAVRQASTGGEAIELARQRRPDLMILDGLMPGKTGFEACKEVKESIHPRHPPKVLIFSAIYTKVRQKAEARSLYGVDDVLAKPTSGPLDEEELLAVVRRHLPPP